jgi:phage terminase large subunit
VNAAIPIVVDWKRPDYAAVRRERTARLKHLRANPHLVPRLCSYYSTHVADFINDWGMTFDPRNIERGLPASVPFLLWPRQREWIEWVIERWRAGEPGLTEKSRDSGVSWLAIALSCTLCRFHRGVVIGVGSRKEEYVDKIGNPKSLFEKARMFMAMLPAEFLDGWTRDQHAPHMRILFPATGSIITGEAGDAIGRGDRTSLYWLDEAAFIDRPELIDASLAGTTNCRIDISTPNGRANPFAIKRAEGKIKVFTFHWRDDPRKDEAWYLEQQEKLDPVTLAQEVDINYSASIEGIIIPSAWVQASIGAAEKLGIKPEGMRCAALDVADEGRDLNAFAGRHGVALRHLEQWSGKGGDIFATVQRAFGACELYDYEALEYDADGLGAGVRGDARIINEARRDANKKPICESPFRGSAAVHNPESEMVEGRKNADYFANLKAQSWWALRVRFNNVYRAVAEGREVDLDSIISIDPNLPELAQLCNELSQPTYSLNAAGKILVDKKPDGARSPNLADAVMIAFNPASRANWLFTWLKLV